MPPRSASACLSAHLCVCESVSIGHMCPSVSRVASLVCTSQPHPHPGTPRGPGPCWPFLPSPHAPAVLSLGPPPARPRGRSGTPRPQCHCLGCAPALPLTWAGAWVGEGHTDAKCLAQTRCSGPKGSGPRVLGHFCDQWGHVRGEEAPVPSPPLSLPAVAPSPPAPALPCAQLRAPQHNCLCTRLPSSQGRTVSTHGVSH